MDVDLKYTTTLHIGHEDMPLAPKKLVIESRELSDFCSDLKSKRSAILPKLAETVFDKKLYLSHQKPTKLGKKWTPDQQSSQSAEI